MKAIGILEDCLEKEKDAMRGYEHLSQITEIQEAIKELEALQQPKSCEWHLGDYDQSSWISKCGAEWILIEDTPLGNGMNFCHKCGGKLIQLETEKDEEDEHE